jgi:HD superfamily phosphohydrolase
VISTSYDCIVQTVGAAIRGDSCFSCCRVGPRSPAQSSAFQSTRSRMLDNRGTLERFVVYIRSMASSPTRRIRTVLYDDQKFSLTEIDLLHTPVLQRLYDLHQLGLTDRVFIDASHSRLHHVVGVVEQTEKMMRSIASNLQKAPNEVLFYAGGPPGGVSKASIAKHATGKIAAVRLMALLHDVTHAPYGHTLEDEIELIAQKHDDPDRQADVFYRLVLQYFAWVERNQDATPWGVNSRTKPADDDYAALLACYLDSPDLNDPPQSAEFIDYVTTRWKELINPTKPRARTLRKIPAQKLGEFTRDLAFAVRALFYLDIAHRDLEDLEAGKGRIPRSNYPVESLLRELLEKAKIPSGDEHRFFPQRDVFLLDVLGNTICADLLDYARRDAAWAGLKLNYDADRIADNMTIVTSHLTTAMKVRQPDGKSLEYPLADACIRTCVSLFSHKLRTDVPGELMSLLQVRYFVYERVLYHPTKCVAGAILGAALQLIGWKKMPGNLKHVGDAVFLYEIAEAAKLLRDLLSKRSAESKFDSALAKSLRDEIEALPVGGISQCTLILISDRVQAVHEIREHLGEACRLRHQSAVAAEVTSFLEKYEGNKLIETVVEELEANESAGKHEAKNILEWLRSNQPSVQTVTDELKAGLRLLDRLAARRYLKITFRLLPNVNVSGVSELKAATIAKLFKKPLPRKIAEREIERRASLPLGSVVIHCPPVKGPTKVAKILITNADVSSATERKAERKVARLNKIGEIDPDVFSHHEVGVNALEDMYRSTWRFAVSVAPPLDAEWKEINKTIGSVLRELLTTAGDTPLENDRYTVLEIEGLEARILELEAEEATAASDGQSTNGRRDSLPSRVADKILKLPEFSKLSESAADSDIEAVLESLRTTRGRRKVEGDRQMTEAELVELMSQYLSFTKLGNFRDPKLRALLRRAQRLTGVGIETFRAEMEPHRSMAPIDENEMKKQSNKSFVKNLNDAITKAEEAQEEAEQR